MREILVLQHADCEPPAAFGDELLARGLRLETVNLHRGDSLPDDPTGRPLVCMGGPMGAMDGGRIEWVDREIDFIARAVAAGTPFWGVCLGAQLLAAALGARVYTGPQPEVGVSDLWLTDAAATDPVVGALPDRFRALQWHGDTFDLPSDATLLISGDVYANQGFRSGSGYGFQFHLEADAELAATWNDLSEYAASLERVAGHNAIDGLVEELRQHDTTAMARALIGRWVDTWHDDDGPRARPAA